MLKYHGRNKPVEDDNLYYKVAEVTAGWSAAALANLMNEAAILTVGGAMGSCHLLEVLVLISSGYVGCSACLSCLSTYAQRWCLS
jgi:cell division protease FtsH